MARFPLHSLVGIDCLHLPWGSNLGVANSRRGLRDEEAEGAPTEVRPRKGGKVRTVVRPTGRRCERVQLVLEDGFGAVLRDCNFWGWGACLGLLGLNWDESRFCSLAWHCLGEATRECSVKAELQ